eukprot:COSAG06_NODE_5168_length_3665_cov_2.995794_3_plen_88_part_00
MRPRPGEPTEVETQMATVRATETGLPPLTDEQGRVTEEGIAKLQHDAAMAEEYEEAAHYKRIVDVLGPRPPLTRPRSGLRCLSSREE